MNEARRRGPSAAMPVGWTAAGAPWSRLPRFLLYAFLIGTAFFYLMPVYVVLTTSLKGMQEVATSSVWALPNHADWSSYAEAAAKLGRGLINSLYLTVPATLLSTLLGSVNGYILTKWRFRGSEALFVFLLFGMFIPYQSVLIPLVRFLQLTGLYGSIPGLALVHVVYGIPVTTLLFRNYYSVVPGELIEASRIDGAGILGIYRRIILPLSAPGFVVALIWQFTSIWNEFLFAVTVTNNPDQQPATVALQGLAGALSAKWNVQMAGSLIAALPTLVIYVFLGRFFLRGLLAGSLKG